MTINDDTYDEELDFELVGKALREDVYDTDLAEDLTDDLADELVDGAIEEIEADEQFQAQITEDSKALRDRWEISEGYWFRRDFRTETPAELSVDATDSDSVGASLLEAAPSRTATTACRQGDVDRFFPDTDEMTTKEWRRFKRRTLPDLAAECATCPFRIGCAITALETQATCGVWAGVLVRDFTSPTTWHRRQLLSILAEFSAHYLAADPATASAMDHKLFDRIELMLQRQERLREPFVEALTEARATVEIVARSPIASSTAAEDFARLGAKDKVTHFGGGTPGPGAPAPAADAPAKPAGKRKRATPSAPAGNANRRRDEPLMLFQLELPFAVSA